MNPPRRALVLQIRTKRRTSSQVGASVACQYPLDFWFMAGQAWTREVPTAGGLGPYQLHHPTTAEEGAHAQGAMGALLVELK